HGPTAVFGVLCPLVGVDIDKVDDLSGRLVPNNIRRHGRTKHEDAIDVALTHERVHPCLQLAIPIIGKTQGFVTYEPGQATELGFPGVEWAQTNLIAPLCKLIAMLPVLRIIDEAA